MPGGSLPVAFGALVAGGVMVRYGVGNAHTALTTPSSSGAPAGVAAGVTAGATAAAKKVGKYPSSVNPVPGASGSRLDAGLDGTVHRFLSPWAGHVVVADAHNSGWQGGGYIVVRSTENPDFAYYAAEGLTPTVKVGDMVTAGQLIGMPVSNPYNGIVGNFEIGLANPSSPLEPLAHSIANPKQMVLDFSAWIRSLGGPAPTSTGNAGYA